MTDLPLQVERFIVKELACETDPEEIVDAVNTKFLREVETSDINAYCPEANGTALTPDLRDLYQVTRWEFQGYEGADPTDKE